MTSVIAAFLVAILPASPAAAKEDPAAYDAAFQTIREKAKRAYLAPSPIDEAVTKDDLQTLEPQDGRQVPAERKQRTADLAEAVKAVKTLQGAPDQPVLAPAEKMRLMRIVYARFGLSDEDQSRAIGTYQPAAMAPAPFAKAPPESVLKETKARQDASAARTNAVMKGSLGELRSVDGGIAAGGAGHSAARGPEVDLRRSDFLMSIKTGPPSAVPSPSAAEPAAQAAEKPGMLARAVAVTRTALPFTTGWKENVAEFTGRRQASADAKTALAAEKWEQGGIRNKIDSVRLSVSSYGEEVVALNPRALKQAGAALAVGTGAVILAVSAPVTAPIAGVALGAKILFTGLTVYTTADATGNIIREPNYANAAGLALSVAGAKYAGPIATKAGNLGEKAYLHMAGRVAGAAGQEAGRKVAAAGAAGAASSAAVGGATAAPIVAQAVVKQAPQKIAGRIAQDTTQELGKEVIETGANKVSAAADHPAPRLPTMMANGQPRGPFNAGMPAGR